MRYRPRTFAKILVAGGTIIAVITWSIHLEYRHEALNRELVGYVKAHDTASVARDLKLGADVDARDYPGAPVSPMQIAKSALKRLLRIRDTAAKQGVSVFQIAMVANDSPTAILLLNAGAHDFDAIMHFPSRFGAGSPMARQQAGMYYDDFPYRDRADDFSPVVAAATWGDVSLVNALIARGARVNARSPRIGTAFIAAASYAPLRGQYPLGRIGTEEWRAAIAPYNEITHVLLHHGVNPNQKEEASGHSVLSLYVAGDDEEIVDELLAHGADPNIDEVLDKRIHDFTPLTWAVGNEYRRIAGALLAHGAKLNEENPDGDTEIIWATRNRDTAMVRLLLAHGADPQITDIDGHDALYYTYVVSMPGGKKLRGKPSPSELLARKEIRLLLQRKGQPKR